MVQQNQFGGASTEEPNSHLGSFLEICDTVKMNGVTEVAIRLCLFSFSLRDKAKACAIAGLQIQTFYSGLNGQTPIVVDSAAGSALLSKIPDEAYALLDEIATNNYQWPSERPSAKKVAGLYEVDPITSVTTQMSSFTNQIAALTSYGSQKKSESILVTSTAY
ncbi:uncharacterized protein LOC111394206 [Olea europaea var. sylvestris]|uniref:uncharacterized protein LOC111394206 n=1 Tax=Olea europaea var. sylvestris TaxID=158386 RepID=UPI000C1D5873|nr:uncharacterized protein LOC111394206 [Olea europaea var. sylvestris]